MTPYYLLIATTIGTTLCDNEWGPRILTGYSDEQRYFPSVVSIRRGFTPSCTGSIINEKWVVTAAHCIGGDKSSVTIVANSGSPRWFKIVDSFRHSKYDRVTLENDIGLIQIDGEFDFDEVTQPIQITDVNVNSTCIVAGWGLTETGDIPKNLQYIEATVLSSQTCKEIYGNQFDEQEICVFAKEGQGICSGDSGGPLICNKKLAGIVSYGTKTCAAGCPDVFIGVANYIHWIQSVINS